MLTDKEFSPIELPIMAFSIKKENKYQIYLNYNDFQTIEAENAAEALELSKIEKPYKITHIINDLISIIDRDKLIEKLSNI